VEVMLRLEVVMDDLIDRFFRRWVAASADRLIHSRHRIQCTDPLPEM
jgi:hypothetical protein